ncbi:alkaline phosphatase D family protein [Parahaliea mediterranea]|uniref:Alkaline phosphatase D family protein n=1 Tax=Parahaliea mediterranea TaxID=651086 RepID=A0A939DG64_9GAMM|nr:alkaline phosphatase D family protein [Parahaliea mediterranea]MBN7797705.1 alkaline phosphatase D family protein [Parahaliea mediterranea]
MRKSAFESYVVVSWMSASHGVSRRDLVKYAACLGLSSLARAATPYAADYPDPFTLGVASGDPLADGVVLWTRLAPELAGGPQLRDADFQVQWQLAHDKDFRRLKASGIAVAARQLAHSVHVEVDGLAPGTRYYYRFIAGGFTSATGRTKTLPAPRAGDPDTALRFATVSCQDYTQGYFHAYEHIASDELDLVIHLGDYIYDWPHKPGAVWGEPGYLRRHVVGHPRSLADFRELHSQYKLQTELQRAHAAHPWIGLLDNHDGIEDSTAPKARKQAAFQAYYEHMPVRLSGAPVLFEEGFKRHFVLDLGDLARFVFLDTRQYKDPQGVCGAGEAPAIDGAYNTSIKPRCDLNHRPGRTMLGERQRSWLLDALAGSACRWNFMVTPCVMTPYDFKPPGGAHFLYGWDGYPEERKAILSHIESTNVSNPVFLSGDWHSFWVNQVRIPGLESRRAAPAEFATTGLTSGYPGNPDLMRQSLQANPQVQYLNVEDRGYVRFHLSAEMLEASCVAVDCTVRERGAARTVARFKMPHRAVDSGSHTGPRVHRVA